jgi:hypothetical protein
MFLESRRERIRWLSSISYFGWIDWRTQGVAKWWQTAIAVAQRAMALFWRFVPASEPNVTAYVLQEYSTDTMRWHVHAHAVASPFDKQLIEKTRSFYE